jgi:hypothetical protein
MGPLWQATRDLHHKAEGHPFAKRMVDGTITAQEWCDWLHAMWVIHTALDPHLPLSARRADAFAHDLLELLPVLPFQSKTAIAYASSLDNVVDIFGAAYITVGAHRRGGRVVEKAMREHGVHLPHHHVHFDQPKEVEGLINLWRETPALEHGARRAFSALYNVMEEIEGRRNGRH